MEKRGKSKKEFQEKIIQLEDKEVGEKELSSILRLVSPGTHFRTALEGALKTGRGALIVIENDHTPELIDGGFKIECRFSPQRLVELCKMDGAIILSRDLKQISYANAVLAPNTKIKSNETGTRHKAAERTAKQTGTLVIAISERKHEITLFYKNKRYPLRSTDELLRKANANVQLSEKQRELFSKNIKQLNHFELRNYANIEQALEVIQRGRMIQKISEELKNTIIELGDEGSLLKARLKELTSGVDKEVNFVIKDYTNLDLKKSKAILDSLSYDELIDSENVLKALAIDSADSVNKIKGWRILSKTSLPEAEIAKIIKETESLGEAIHSGFTVASEILGEESARAFKEEIRRIKLS